MPRNQWFEKKSEMFSEYLISLVRPQKESENFTKKTKINPATIKTDAHFSLAFCRKMQYNTAQRKDSISSDRKEKSCVKRLL